jgi:hypothetical protein
MEARYRGPARRARLRGRADECSAEVLRLIEVDWQNSFDNLDAALGS